ncbi:ATP-binding protein [Halorussus pelagicus]|uniref:ATP-binding protein n=1 Tax=Halorussus pelagicus TaxID=2505977 RepID=UPI000FFC3D9F|nr:ATP-binding protein [Halorussus pelagicus]
MTISVAAISAGFNALPGQAAVLDRSGYILITNRAWREFAVADGPKGDHVGENYLSVCDASEDGTGLGLAIVEQVVDAHDWTIDVTESASNAAIADARQVTPDGGRESPASPRNRGARFEVAF